MVDNTGCAGGGVISVFNGGVVPLRELPTEAMGIGVIAHALSNLCRYTGHCLRFYSVAEHSWRMWMAAKRENQPVHIRHLILLHDAAEAFVGDISRPVKLMFPEIAEFEHAILLRILCHYRLHPSEKDWSIVKEYDNRALKTEVRELMSDKGEGWGLDNLAELPPNQTEFGMRPTIAKLTYASACMEDEGLC